MVASVDSAAIRISPSLRSLLNDLLQRTECAFNPTIGIEWVYRHENCHIGLKHFEILTGVPTFNLIGLANEKKLSLPKLPTSVWDKVERCLELQADHEALDEMIGAFVLDEDWRKLRTKIASIAAVMVLIETIDADNPDANITHPKAATRIFQLLGHVSELWSIRASFNEVEELPAEEKVQEFSKEVILPAYHDAVTLAQSAMASSIVANLGEPSDFFGEVVPENWTVS